MRRRRVGMRWGEYLSNCSIAHNHTWTHQHTPIVQRASTSGDGRGSWTRDLATYILYSEHAGSSSTRNVLVLYPIVIIVDVGETSQMPRRLYAYVCMYVQIWPMGTATATMTMKSPSTGRLLCRGHSNILGSPVKESTSHRVTLTSPTCMRRARDVGGA